MKNFILILVLFNGLAANAQNTNVLLDQTFWKNKPDLAKVKLAVDNGSNPSEKNAGAFDPVVLAINNEAANDVINYLLVQKGNDVNKTTHDSRIYLHWAAMRGNADIVKTLIEKGSKISVEDSHGTTPFLFAAGSGQQNTAVYDLLINAGVNPKTEVNQTGANALLVSAANDKNMKLADYFVTKGLDLNSKDANGDNIFSYAARAGNIETLKALQAKGVKPTNAAYLFAAQAGGRRTVAMDGATPTDGLPLYQYLESIGLKPAVLNKEGQNVIHLIARKPKQTNVLNYFIGKGVDPTLPDNEGNTPFMIAAATNLDLAFIALLAGKSTNINQTNERGETALALALKSNTAAVVDDLITKGESINVIDKKGDNLGAYLLQAYNPRNVLEFNAKIALLKGKGFNFNQTQGDGSSLYHLAAVKGDIDLLKKITNLNIDVNIKNKDGLTALQKAAMVAKTDAELKYLISIGADKNTTTSFGETAFDLATENETLTKNKVSITFLK